MDNMSNSPKTTLSRCAQFDTINSTVEKPVSATNLVDDDQSTTIEKFVTSSSLDTPKNSNQFHSISVECSTNTDSPPTQNNRAILNIGGVRHEVMWHTLARLPHTRLGRLAELYKSKLSDSISHDELLRLCDDYDLSRGEFFFDRQPRTFISIINLYRTGKLHLIDDICILSFDDDLKYWDINEYYLELCCQNKYHQKKEYALEEIKKEVALLKFTNEEILHEHCCPNTRQKIWDLFEHPQTSMIARIIAFISITFILLSSFTLTISTIEGIGCISNRTENKSTLDHVSISDTQSTIEHYELDHDCREPFILFIIEILCISWFTIEYLIRIYATPNKCKFFKSVLNTIDLIAILPFYISILLEILYKDNIKNMKSARKIVQMFRILRIIRILKLARYSTDLQSLGYTLKRSSKELSMLLIFLAISIILFSSLAYFAEKDENAVQFQSIPHAFWWASITMTTVGYGDMYPKSIWGKLIGSVCGICGVLVIALPIPIIVNNFAEYYQERIRHEKALKRKEAIKHAQKTGLTISVHSEFTSNSNLSSDNLNVRRTSVIKCISPVNDEPLYDSTCYEKKIPSKQIQHTIDRYSDKNQHKKQHDEDVKETLLNRDNSFILKEQRNIVLKT